MERIFAVWPIAGRISSIALVVAAILVQTHPAGYPTLKNVPHAIIRTIRGIWIQADIVGVVRASMWPVVMRMAPSPARTGIIKMVQVVRPARRNTSPVVIQMASPAKADMIL